jgi:hypothetical protein
MFREDMQRYVTELSRLLAGPLARGQFVRVREVHQHMGDLLAHVETLMAKGRRLTDGDWDDDVLDDDDEDEEETEGMDHKERDRLLLFRDAIEDAGIARQARGDALTYLEQHYQGQDPIVLRSTPTPAVH